MKTINVVCESCLNVMIQNMLRENINFALVHNGKMIAVSGIDITFSEENYEKVIANTGYENRENCPDYIDYPDDDDADMI